MHLHVNLTSAIVSDSDGKPVSSRRFHRFGADGNEFLVEPRNFVFGKPTAYLVKIRDCHGRVFYQELLPVPIPGPRKPADDQIHTYNLESRPIDTLSLFLAELLDTHPHLCQIPICVVADDRVATFTALGGGEAVVSDASQVISDTHDDEAMLISNTYLVVGGTWAIVHEGPQILEIYLRTEVSSNPKALFDAIQRIQSA